jgi:deoxyadenosine/deoxycytidine kinase
MLKEHPPEYYKYLPLKYLTCSINGPIGVGKSNLAKKMTSRLNQIFPPNNNNVPFAVEFPENIDWYFLPIYIANQPKYAFPFQLSVLAEQLDTDRNIIAHASTGGFSIADRDLIGNIGFALGNHEWRVDGQRCIDEEQLDIYMHHLASKQRFQTDVMIVLDVPMNVAISRMAARDREGESKYDPNYHAAVNAGFEKALAKYYKNPVLRIPWAKNYAVPVDANGDVIVRDPLWERDLSESGAHMLSESQNHKVEIPDEVIDRILDDLLKAIETHRKK